MCSLKRSVFSPKRLGSTVSTRQSFVTSLPAMIPVLAALRAALMPILSLIGPTPANEITALPSSFFGSVAGRAEAIAAGTSATTAAATATAAARAARRVMRATLTDDRGHRQSRDALAAAYETHPLSRRGLDVDRAPEHALERRADLVAMVSELGAFHHHGRVDVLDLPHPRRDHGQERHRV